MDVVAGRGGGEVVPEAGGGTVVAVAVLLSRPKAKAWPPSPVTRAVLLFPSVAVAVAVLLPPLTDFSWPPVGT